MARFILIAFVAVFCVACGKGGGSPQSSQNGAVNPTPTPVQCKEINSVWHSTTDQETHDLTSVGTSYAAYHYWDGDNNRCGYYQGLDVAMAPFTHPDVPTEYTHLIRFQFSTAPGPNCTYWMINVTDTYGWALVKHECNTLTLCRDAVPTIGHCKTFE